MDLGHPLEFGVFITPAAEQPETVLGLAEVADRAGLDLLSFQDHPYQRRFLETWTLLSNVAARTSRVRLLPNVLNVPLRLPPMIGKSAATLDLLSGGRLLLGLGAGAFWDGIAHMGGPRLTPGESVDALDAAVDDVRAQWDGPIGLGAYKPRMLRLTGRKADAWLPSLGYIEPEDFGKANATIDGAARKAGRDPRAIRRMLNVLPGGPLQGPVAGWVDQLVHWALEEGFSAFVLAADDPLLIESWAGEVAPVVRERVEAARASAALEAGDAADEGPAVATGPAPSAPAAAAGDDEYARLGVTPTAAPDTAVTAWEERDRPRRPRSGPEVTYTDQGRQVGQHLVDVHDMLRKELGELRGLVEQVRDGAVDAGAARSTLNAMALRQNDWTLGAFCSRYCRVVAGHHGLEDDSIFPHLRQADDRLVPVIDRLEAEHHVIHDAIEGVDGALVHHITHPGDFTRLQQAIDRLTDALLSHLAYEEEELVEPLARLGFYAGQV